MTSNKVFLTSLGRNSELARICRGQGESEERRRLIGGRVNKQGNPIKYEPCLRMPQNKEISAPTCQNLKVHIEVLAGFSRIPSRGLNNPLFSQVCILERTLAVGIVGRMYISPAELGVGSPQMPRVRSQPTAGLVLQIPPPTTQYSIKA